MNNNRGTAEKFSNTKTACKDVIDTKTIPEIKIKAMISESSSINSASLSKERIGTSVKSEKHAYCLECKIGADFH
jgi:hypothetical protein